MMGMSLQMVMGTRQYLSAAHKLELKSLLALSQKSRHGIIPEAATGFEGMEIADDILKREGAVGVLVGSLAEGVWSQKRTLEQLSAHRDVDVLVTDSKGESIDRFEGGIDWWLPEEGSIDLLRGSAPVRGYGTNWWENGFGVVCPVGVKVLSEPKPGLYIHRIP